MKCPICHKPVKGREDKDQPNVYFPFCSERCKLIDLGRWLDGRYQLPAEVDPDEGAEDNPVIGGH